MSIGNPQEPTLWEGASQTLTSLASGGKVSPARYRVTPLRIYFEKGVVRTDSQEIPLAQVTDVDLKQSMTQKARGIGDVVVHVLRGTGTELVTLEAVQNPKNVRDVVNNAAREARLAEQRLHNTYQHNSGQPVPPQPPSAPPAAPPASAKEDIMGQLAQLGQLRDAGVLTNDEFDAKKADLLSRL